MKLGERVVLLYTRKAQSVIYNPTQQSTFCSLHSITPCKIKEAEITTKHLYFRTGKSKCLAWWAMRKESDSFVISRNRHQPSQTVLILQATC